MQRSNQNARTTLMRSTGWLPAFVAAATWTLAAALPGQAAQAADTPAAKPNVLFIIADDLNCDLGCYGHPMVQSPNIDRLAGRGLKFQRAYCQFPLCGPSRASMMCGLYPDQTLIRRNAIRVRQRLPNVQTMAQMFRNHGYTAARVGKIYHYGVPRDIGTDGHDDPPSWDQVFNPRGRDKDEESKIFSLRPGQFGGTLSWLAADGTVEQQTDGIGATHAVKLLETFATHKTPFFLAVGFYRPHTPYVAPKQYFDMYPSDQIVVPTVPAGYLDALPKPAQRTLTAKREHRNLSDETTRRAIQAYYASITFMDAQVGRVVDALERLNLDKNTIVIMTSDHGYHMGEHGHFMKQTLYENATRVPLIIAVPGMQSANQSTASLAEMLDFYPTLAELCGLEAPDYLQGVSLAPILSDPAARVRQSVLSQHHEGYALRTEQHRFISWGPQGRDGVELYDHESDSAEMVNLAQQPGQGKTVSRLARMIAQRVATAQRRPDGLQQIEPPNRSRRGKAAASK